MKKLLLIGFSAALFLGACGTEEAAEKPAADDKQTAAGTEEKADTKQELIRFYMSISKTINAADADLNTFEINQAEGTLPEGADLQAMTDAAKISAEATSEAVAGIEIPAALEEQTADIKGAFEAIQQSYDMKAEELTKEASFEAANEKFLEADETFNVLLEEQELAASSLYNEVSQ